MPVTRKMVPQHEAPAPPPDQQPMVEVVEAYAEDKRGQRIEIGDTVTLTLKVTGIRALPGDPSRDVPEHDVLEVAIPLENGHDLHHAVVEADHVEKAGGARKAPPPAGPQAARPRNPQGPPLAGGE